MNCPHLGDVGEATAGEQVSSIAHEVQEGAIRGLADHGAAGLAPALGRGRHTPPLVVHHKRVERAVQRLWHGLVEALRQAVHHVL